MKTSPDPRQDPFNPKKSSFFEVSLITMHLLVTSIFLVKTDYINPTVEAQLATAGKDNNVATYYFHYSGVAFMIFIGFGFLMSFLRRYSYSAIGYTLLVSAFCAEWGAALMMYAQYLHSGNRYGSVGVEILIEGCFAAGCVMISFGAMLGRVSHSQLLVIAFFELIFYTANYYICAYILKATDIGGSMVIHTFGAYFGLAVSRALNSEEDISADSHAFNESRTTRDVFAMFGTIFLWLLWPSFNSALAGPGTQGQAIMSTVLALQGSAVTAFVVSRLVRGKFNMVHIQNSTLAGGVAVGAVADLMTPAGALGLGSLAGALSVLGYQYLTPRLADSGIPDVCGVHNLHGLPGLLSAIASIIVVATYPEGGLFGRSFASVFSEEGATTGSQALAQLGALAVTLLLSLIGGTLVGMLVRSLSNSEAGKGMKQRHHFNDRESWHVAHDFRQY